MLQVNQLHKQIIKYRKNNIIIMVDIIKKETMITIETITEILVVEEDKTITIIITIITIEIITIEIDSIKTIKKKPNTKEEIKSIKKNKNKQMIVIIDEIKIYFKYF